jgi:hypothetical protein
MSSSSKDKGKKDKGKLCSWGDITNIDRFKSLSSLLRKYGMKVYSTSYERVFVTENGDKKGIIYPYALFLSKKEITHRRTFWDFESPEFAALLVPEERRDLPFRMLISNKLTLALHRDMQLSTTLSCFPEYVYDNGVLSRLLGEAKCPIAQVTKDNTFVHVFIADEHIVRSKSYLRDLDAPIKELPFEFIILRERIVSLFVSRNFEDLLRNKAQGVVEDGFHPCYQIDSVIGSFIYYALSPPVVEFKNPSITLILPPSFDMSVQNVGDYMKKIPSPKVLARLLQGYIVGPMLMEFMKI